LKLDLKLSSRRHRARNRQSCATLRACPSGLNLAGHLLDFDDHKFGWLERRESDDDVDNA
jgi:hypothetical protein